MMARGETRSWRSARRLAVAAMALVLVACASGPDKPQPAELSPNAALISVRLAWSARIMQLHHQGLQLADIIKDPELEKIRWKFNPRLVDRDRFDHFHGRLVENTIKAETAAAEEG